jgi:DNA helicase-2/ATP-dependent DNA helicase PcrA
MSIHADNPETEIEEERRLCYVGITRAMKRLGLSAASQRMLRGETQFNRPSRFINEIPRYLLTMERNPFKMNSLKSNSYTSLSDSNDRLHQTGNTPGGSSRRTGGAIGSNKLNDSVFQKPYEVTTPREFEGKNLGTIDYGIGDTVQHIKFGVGIVTNINSGGKDYEVTVDFSNFGIKKMLASFAKLKKL